MNSYMRMFAIVVIAMTSVVSCNVGKKPVRKQVTIEQKTKERYGTIGVDTPGTPVKTVKAAPAVALNEKKRELITALQPLWNREIAFKTFNGKAKMHFEARGSKQEFTAHFRIAKDKTIWVNVTALGGVVPVARILITPDSILLMNNLAKEATRMRIADANKLFPVPVDFNTFQNLIIGDVIQRTGKPTDATDFGGTLTLQVENKTIIQNIAYNKTDSTMRSLQLLSKEENGPSGMIQFGNYELISARNFAKSRVVNVSNAGEPYYLDMNFTNVAFDEELEFPFTIPKNYTIK